MQNQNLIRQQGCISRNPEEPGRCKTMSVNHAKRFGPMKNDIRQQQYRHDYRQQQMLARNRFYRSYIIVAPAETTSISTAAAVHQQYIYSRFHRPPFASAATTSISAAAAVHQQYSSFHDQVNSMHQQQGFHDEVNSINR